MSSCWKKQEILLLNFRDKNKEEAVRRRRGGMNTLIEGGPCFRAVPFEAAGTRCYILRTLRAPSPVSASV